MGKKWNWSEESRAAHSERMRAIWKAKRMSEGQRKAWTGANERRVKAKRDLKSAWDMSKATVLLKIGKFQIIWG